MSVSVIELSVFTAATPKVLSKSFTLQEDGTLQKHGGGKLVQGVCEKKKLIIAEFPDLLKSLGPQHAVSFGVNGHDRARIVPQDDVHSTKATDLPVTSRTRENFHWPEGSGVLLLDYDPPKHGPIMIRNELLTTLYSTCPELEHHPHIWRPSASSCIHRVSDGAELSGIRGQRIYVFLRNAADILRVGQAIYDRSWLAGHGRFDISKSGALMDRGLVDSSVWQPERLDFAGGAFCGKGLEQRRPDPLLINADAPFLDSAMIISLNLQEKAKLEKIKDEAKKALKDQVQLVRERWISERIETAMKTVPDVARPMERQRLEDVFRRAVEAKSLMADFILVSETHGEVSVGEVLDDPDKYHGTKFADPLEPEYQNSNMRIAWANLRTVRPYLWSYAHGGMRYVLHRAIKRIIVSPGQLHKMIDECLDVVATDGVVYDRGVELGRIAGSSIAPVEPQWLSVYLSRRISFERFDARSKKLVPIDCPEKLAKAIPKLVGEWKLPKLRAVITAPTITTTGRVIDQDGFDEETGIFLDFPDSRNWRGIPDTISTDQVREAASLLWRPFQDFPFVGPVDRGVMFASVLTAQVRQVLPTAPGFQYDAPSAGSGKTLLATCISLLAGVESPAMLPRVETDEELRKRVFAVARANIPVMILDNLDGQFKSEALCAYLTAQTWSDRILGVSEMGTAPANAMVLLTGNNVSLVGDLNRRVLRSRIDPMMERPFTRRFRMNPELFVKENRLEMVRAALLLMRAYLQSGSQSPSDSMASFEAWSDLVRQTVLWIGGNRWLDVEDPCESIIESYEQDPETLKLGALLSSWHAMFGPKGSTVSKAISTVRPGSYSGSDAAAAVLQDSLLEVAGDRGNVNPRMLGRWIERHSGRIVGGMKFRKGEKLQNKWVWCVDLVKFQDVSFVSNVSSPPLYTESVSDSFMYGEKQTHKTNITNNIADALAEKGTDGEEVEEWL